MSSYQVKTGSQGRDTARIAEKGLLSVNRDDLAAVGRTEFGLLHSVYDHPLLSLEALAGLADSLPARAVECHEAKQPLVVPGGRTELSVKPSEIVRGIETNDRWMVLWNIEQVTAYRALLNEILDPIAPLLPATEGAMGRREAFLFLSAPNSVTPCHFDPENNFLLQIKGKKQVKVGRFPGRVDALRELDRYHDGGHRNLDKLPALSGRFDLTPGEGVYLYPWAPHWVYNGPAVSISLSITFRTRRSEREELVHRYNSRLRRLGLSPRPAGENTLVDRIKAAWVSGKAWLRRGGRREYGARDYTSGRRALQ